MAKMKVHELAKELDIQSKDICQILNSRGADLKPQSAISDEDAKYIKERFAGKAGSNNAKVETPAKTVKEENKEPAKEEKAEAKEENKPKRIITSRGMVRPKGPDGERKRRPDGEKRRRPEAEGEVKTEEVKQETVVNEGKDIRVEKEVVIQEVKAVENKKVAEQEVVEKNVQVEVKEPQKMETNAEHKNAGTNDRRYDNRNNDRRYDNRNGDNRNNDRRYDNRNGENRPTERRYDNRNGENRPTERRYDNRNGENRPTERRYDNRNGENRPTERRYDNRNGENRPTERRYDNRNGENRPTERRYDNRNGENRPTERRYDNRNGENRPTERRYDNRNGENRPTERRYDNRNGEQRTGDNNRTGDRPFNRDGRPGFNRTGDRPFNRDGRPGFNRDGRSNDGRTDNRPGDNRNNRSGGYNKDGGFNKDANRGTNDRRNDRRRPGEAAPVAETAIQEKDRKARENKLRQDKQERNKKDHSDAAKKNRNRTGVQTKSPLQRPQQKKEEKKEEIKVIIIPEVLTIGELAEKMKMQSSSIIKKLFLEGKLVTVNSEVDFETAEEIALGYEIMCEKEVKVDVIEELLKEEDESEETMEKRPPVVCVMGHVDHGKTSLLDAIKESNVISGEAGGITQHIGAYMVEVNGEKITFLDTPGHEAFTAMRMRGAQSTDIAILVVAADDGVMPQTVEAISHAKAAGIEIIVAINKIDKPGANLDRVKQELTEYELVAEDWGGSTICVPVSAHTKEGLDKLLEMVLLQADVLELKANPDRLARGLVIEGNLDKGKGSVATLLIQKGTLHVGDHIAAGSHSGKVRAMVDDKGNKVKAAGPSTPVKILGLNGVPNAGEVFVSTETGNEARSFAETFITDSREKLLEGTKYRLSLDDLNSQIEAGNLKELNLIIKADVQGSVEAIKQSLIKLSNEEVEIKVIHGGVGAINESDVSLASASNAIIIGFNVKPDNQAQEVADREKVDVRLYSVIYSAIEDVEAAMKGMLDPIFEEKVLGHAEIRQIFKASGIGNIAGSYVLDGTFERNCQVRITREGEKIYEGPLASLKRFKDDVKEVKTGYECGLVFENFNAIQEFDQVEAYKMVEVPR